MLMCKERLKTRLVVRGVVIQNIILNSSSLNPVKEGKISGMAWFSDWRVVRRMGINKRQV